MTQPTTVGQLSRNAAWDSPQRGRRSPLSTPSCSNIGRFGKPSRSVGQQRENNRPRKLLPGKASGNPKNTTLAMREHMKLVPSRKDPWGSTGSTGHHRALEGPL
eukprot:1451670-Heterocapsa_arctica.AAC.1